jgi:hypothetical protein
MPFDATALSVIDQIRLTPISMEIVVAHKRQVEAAVRDVLDRNSLGHYAGLAHWLEAQANHWQNHRNPTEELWNWIEGWLGPIPMQVKAIAEKAQGRLREAGVEKPDISVQFYYTDPILWLRWKTGRACLAIWDYETTAFWGVGGKPGRQPVVYHMATLA